MGLPSSAMCQKPLFIDSLRSLTNAAGAAGCRPQFLRTLSSSHHRLRLRPDQKDTDSLPEYPVLDAILNGYVERNESAAKIAKNENLPIDVVRDIIRKVERNEYKRQQAAPGLKITTKAFGVGRRFPIAHRFTE